MPDDGHKERDPSFLRGLGYSTVGMELAFSIIIGYLLGRWLDGHFETRPWLTMTFTVVGVVAGFRALWRAGKRALMDDAREEAEARRRQSKEDDGSGSAGTR